MAMLLPATFAACTSDEFEAYDNSNSLANRKEIGKVSFSFNNGEANTRWDASFLPEVSDVFGAAMADIYIGENTDKPADKWNKNYTITDYIQTNYPYTNNGTAWTSEANLVEGNYLFYAPYGQSHQVRTAIKYETPVSQKLEVKDGAIVENSAMKNVAAEAKAPFYVAYKFLDSAEDNTNISIAMRSLFSYPLFTLKNTSGEAVTITRILVQSAGNDIVASGTLDNNKVITALRSTKDGEWGGSLATNMKGKQYTTDMIGGEIKYTNLLRADLSEKITIANNGQTSFDIVMPAQQFAVNELKLYFVTESGKAYTWSNGAGGANSTITTVPGRRYPAEDYDLNGNKKTAAGQLLTKTIKKDESLEDAPYIVTSKAELISAISGTPASQTALNLTVVGDVDFDAEVLKAIAEKTSQTVTFKGNINIVGGAGLDINQNVIFDEAVVKSGIVKLDKETVDFNKMTVAEGATLKVDKVDDNLTRSVINNGALELNAAVGKIENYAEMTLGAKGSYSSLTVNPEKPQTVTISGTVDFNGTELNGTWNVPASATLNLKEVTTLPYGSELTVEGKLTGEKLTVSGEMNVSGRSDAEIEVNGTYVAEPTAANPNKPAVLNCNAGSLFVGAISGAAGNVPAQIINVKDGANFFGTFTNTNTTAVYTIEGNVSDISKVTVPTVCNKVVVNGTLTPNADWSMTTVKELVVNGDVLVNGTYAITTATGASTVTVNGSIFTKNTLTFTNTTGLTVTGELNTIGGGTVTATDATEVILNKVTLGSIDFTLAAATTVVVNGELIAGSSVTISKEATLTLKGNVTLADGKSFTMTEGNKVEILGNVKIDVPTFTASKATTVNVYGGKTLTIGNRTSMSGADGQVLTFASSKKATPEAATEGTVGGKVVNQGKVGWAASAYEEGNPEWWTGTTANTTAIP